MAGGEAVPIDLLLASLGRLARASVLPAVAAAAGAILGTIGGLIARQPTIARAATAAGRRGFTIVPSGRTSFSGRNVPSLASPSGSSK